MSLGRADGGIATTSRPASSATTRPATRPCGRPRSRPTSASRSAATSSAPTASCPHPRPGAEPPARTHLAEVRQLVDQGCKEVTLLGQTVNSYRYEHGDRVTRLSRPHRGDARHARSRTHQVRDQLPEGHDRRPARRRPRTAEGREVPARPGAIGLRRSAQADEAELHRRLLHGDARPLPRAGAGRVGQFGLHRRLLRRDGGELPQDDGPGPRREVQELVHLQVQRTRPARRPPTATPTTCPRR